MTPHLKILILAVDLFTKIKMVNKGLSLYFGSRQSPLYFNFYQKDYELARKESMSVEEAREKHEIKNRYEIRLSDEKAFCCRIFSIKR